MVNCSPVVLSGRVVNEFLPVWWMLRGLGVVELSGAVICLGSLVVVFFTLANAPLLSPLALFGVPAAFLLWEGWWLIGNVLAIVGMFLLGGLLHQINECTRYNRERVENDPRLRRSSRISQRRKLENSPSVRRDPDSLFARDQASPALHQSPSVAPTTPLFASPFQATITNMRREPSSIRMGSPLAPLRQRDTWGEAKEAEEYIVAQMQLQSRTPTRRRKEALFRSGSHLMQD